MELRLVSQKTLNGLSVRTDNAAEMGGTTGKIGPLWQKFDELVPVDYKNGERVYGVYTDYDSDHTGPFTVTAAFDGDKFPSNVGLSAITILEGEYLVFKHKGEMPQIAIDAWTDVWNYFCSDQVEYERLYTTDFEYYPYGNEIEVHIAVQPKSTK